MTRANDNPNITRQRTLIANAAARLIAEDGINDYAVAKRKAAHRLGFSDTVNLPENDEVEAELRLYHRLFQDREQIARVARLRQKATGIMSKLNKFNPYLTGSVLDGTAARYAEIDIQLFTDSTKDVEIFLLNQHIDYEHSTPRSERAEAVLTSHEEDTVVNLIIYPAQEERVTFKTRDGRNRQRARLDAVNKLLIASRTDSR
jgi:hypothetical protein